MIAKDLFSKFDKAKLLDPAMPTKYRKTVLAPGGSKPAAEVVPALSLSQAHLPRPGLSG